MKTIKKRMIIGSLFFMFLLLSIPALPAVEVTLVREEYKSSIADQIEKKSLLQTNLFEKITKQFGQKTSISDLIDHLGSSEEEQSFSAQSIVLLDIIIIVLFLLGVFKGIPNFFQNIYAVIMTIANSAAFIIKTIADLLFNLLVFSGESLVTLLIGIGQVIVQILELGGIAVVSLIAGIISVIGLILFGIVYGIVNLASLVWSGIETVLGLILDILRLIYEAIFQQAPLPDLN
jgi:hypothetical protein